MVKKELSVRERRKIFEDTICIVAKTQKLSASGREDRALASLVRGQIDKCTNIIATSLGYRESVIENDDGIKNKVYTSIIGQSEQTISKDLFTALVQRLPKEKALKETMWKAAVKNDKKAIAIFNEMVA